MTQRNPWEKTLLAGLRDRLVPHGFEPKIHGQACWVKTADGRASVHLNFGRYVDHLNVTVDVGLRFDELESLKNRCRSDLSPKESQDTYTLGVDYGNLLRTGWHPWVISSQDDLPPAIKAIGQAVANTLIPWIQTYSNPDVVFQLMLNDHEAQHVCLRHVVAINAVGLAILLGKGQMVDDLIEAKTEYLQSVQDRGLPLFRRFVDCIKKRQLI